MKKLSLLFVLVLAFVMLFAFSASAKNITKEASKILNDGGGYTEATVDGNPFTGGSCGGGSWVNYHYLYENGTSVSKVVVVVNSIGEVKNADGSIVATHTTLSTLPNIYCRIYSGGSTLWKLENQPISGDNVQFVKNAKDDTIYAVYTFTLDKQYDNVTKVEVATVHSNNSALAIWEVDIFDNQACTAETHEWQNGICGTKKTCNACNAVSEELSTTEHFWRPASCAGPKQCYICCATEGESVGEHIPEADDNDCSTAVRCTVCNSIVVAAKKHTGTKDSPACTNEGCTRSGLANIANQNVEVNVPGWWWAVAPQYLVDGDYLTGCNSPKQEGFNYNFIFDDERLISKVTVHANGTVVCVADWNNRHENTNNVSEVSVQVLDKNGLLIYETEIYSFTDKTEVTIELPYTYYAYQVNVKFKGAASAGFVREIEIYDTTVENLDPEFIEIVAPQEGCFDRVNFKDEIEEKLYYDQVVRGDETVLEYFYVVDEDGNYILDENGNVIKYAGAPVGGNAWANPQGCELDGVVDTGYCVTWEGSYNNIQYNFKEKLLFAEITIGYKTSGNVADGYKLYIGDVVDGEEVWTLVVDFEVGEGHTAHEYLLNTFTLGEEDEGVEGTMFRFEWIPGVAIRNNPSLCEVDMLTFKNTCTWTENQVDVEGNCGYDRVAKCTCSVCGVEKTVVTALATGEHDLTVTKEATKATCVDFGYNTTKYCATCQKTFGGDRIEKPLGHDMSVAATCTTAKSCSRCDHTEGDPLGHKEGTKATCTSKAVCSVCEQEYGDFAAHTLVDLKCTACNKYVVTTYDQLLSAIDKCSSTEKETIVLGADIITSYNAGGKYITLTKPITIDFAGKTLQLGTYQNGFQLRHSECALISSVGTGTFDYVGNVAAIKLFNADTIQNININVKTTTANNPVTGISIQLAKDATSAHVNSIKNVRIDGEGLTVGFETYQCGSNAALVINEMENVVINATYNGKAGKDFNIIGMTLQAPCGTFTNCTVTSAEEGVRFRASANWSMTGTFVNCQVTGGTHGLNMYSDGDISSTAVLAFKSDANTTFTCTSNPEKSFTAALNGAIDNIEVEISGVKMVAYIDGQFYGSFEEAYAVVPDGGTLQILADVELTDSLVIDKKITLDLNKYTVSAPNGKAGDGVFHVVAGGELTIKGNGTVNGICANEDGYHMAIWADGGKVVINGGTFTNVGAGEDTQYDLIYVKNGGSVVINGGTFIAQTPKWTLNAKDNDGSTIVVNGGKFYAYNPTESASENPAVDFTSGKCAVKNSENYYVLGEHVYFNSCDARCEACGKITKEPTHNIVHVTAKAPTCTEMGNLEHWYCDICGAAWLDEALISNTNLRAVKLPATGHTIANKWTYDAENDVMVKTCANCPEVMATAPVVAKINGIGYASLEDAVAVGGEITLEADIDLAKAVVINNNVTINLNGKTLTVKNDTTGDGVFKVVAGGVLTINGEGTVNGVGNNNYNIAIWANGGSVVINGGTYTNVGAGEDDHYDLIYAKNGGSVVINGGTFIAQTPKWTLNIYGTNTGTIVVNGGSFYAYNPTESTSEGPVVDFTSGKCAVKNSENYYVLGEHQYFNSCDARCEACGKITKEPTHNIVHVTAKAPTCTANGNVEYWYCDICGAAWTDEALTQLTNQKSVIVPATGHSYANDCDKACAVCYEITRPEADHTIVHVDAKAATCTANGNKEYWTCSDCGYAWLDEACTLVANQKSVIVPATGHSYFTQCDPVCMNCYELTNPDAAHKITHVTAVAPTCTENGNIEYWYCEYCNTAWTSEALNTPPMGIKSTTLPATGHTKVEIPAVRPTPSNGNKAYTAGIKCADCNDIIQEVEEITVVQNQNTGFQIYNASLGLSDDITLIYLTYIPEEYRENAYMVFTYRGTEYVVDTKEEKDGIYRFRFSAVTPQYVGENIESVLYSKVNGEYVKTGTINYSVLAFCASWLNYDKTPVKTRTLMSDFLVYAAAAQVATNVNVDKLVTDGFGDKLTPSTFSKLDDSQFVMRLEGTADSRFAWKNVSLTLGSSVAMKFYFTATETENLKIKITINGRTQIIDFADCEYDTTYECYTASFTNITAIEFADEVKAEFMVGEEIVGNSALYTIDSFVYQWQSVTDSKYEKTINLVKALYNYGKSAWNSVH